MDGISSESSFSTVSTLSDSDITEEAGTLKDNNDLFEPFHHLTTANNLSTGINFNINTVDIDIDDLTHRSKAPKKHEILGTPLASFGTSEFPTVHLKPPTLTNVVQSSPLPVAKPLGSPTSLDIMDHALIHDERRLRLYILCRSRGYRGSSERHLVITGLQVFVRPPRGIFILWRH